MFKFPRVETVLYFLLNTECINSFVVVFPLLPVNAIMVVFLSFILWYPESDCKDFKTLFTFIKFGFSSLLLSITAYLAPLLIASKA